MHQIHEKLWLGLEEGVLRETLKGLKSRLKSFGLLISVRNSSSQPESIRRS